MLYPWVGGELLIGTTHGATEADAQAALAPYVQSVAKFATDTYQAKVTPFREQEVREQIKARVGLVQYIDGYWIIRLVDFAPEWFVDRGSSNEGND